jgi:phosphatidate cytidylyltransferase
MTLGSLFANPLDNQLFGPTVVRIGALLAIGALIVVLVERKPWRELRETTLFKRIFSWSVMAPTFLAAVFVGGPIGLVIVIYLIVQGLAEYERLVGIERRYAWLLLFAGVATPVLTGLLSPYFLFAPLAFFVLVTLIPIVSGEVEGAHLQVTSALFGFLYIPFFLSYLVFIRLTQVNGLELLLLVGVSVALSDVIAFVTGSVVGGPLLAPNVSPNKTWAGLAGNIVGAFAGWALMWFAVPEEWTVVTRIVAPLVLGLAAVWGDLIESFVKRDFKVKDAGTLLPGFGGVLDRIDSLLVALPISYYAIVITQHFSFAPPG